MPPSDSETVHLAKQNLMVEALTRHGWCYLQVLGSSMVPTLWPNDTVHIEARAWEKLQPGDIVLYEMGGRLYLHRLKLLQSEASGGVLITRGDAVPQDDPAVSASCLLGVLAAVRRGDTWVAVPRNVPMARRIGAMLLAKSELLMRLLLRFRIWNASLNPEGLPETPPA